MTQALYRKEALENRNRSLYGEIALRTSPASWVLVLLLCILTSLIVSGLFFLKIPNGTESVTLLDWLYQSLFKAGTIS